MKQILICFIFLIGLSSCKNKPDGEGNMSNGKWDTSDGDSIYPRGANDEQYIDRLFQRSLQGDSLAFNELAGFYMIKEKYHDLVYLSSVVANKYSIPDAYYILYWSYRNPDYNIHREVKEQLNLLDTKTRMLTLYYLLRGRELGQFNSINAARDIFGDSIPKSKVYIDSFAILSGTK